MLVSCNVAVADTHHGSSGGKGIETADVLFLILLISPVLRRQRLVLPLPAVQLLQHVGWHGFFVYRITAFVEAQFSAVTI